MDLDWRTHELSGGGGGLERADDEWLLTNGTGSYAMGTVSGVDTRPWHGWFVPWVGAARGHVVVIDRMLERVRFEEGEVGVCEIPDGEGRKGDSVRGGGRVKLERFEKGLGVRWTYLLEGRGGQGRIELVRELVLHWKRQAATVRYSVRGLNVSLSGAVLRVSPLLALGDARGGLDKGAEGGRLSVERVKGGGAIKVCRGGVEVSIRCEGGAIVADEWDKRRVSFSEEAGQRGRGEEEGVIRGWFEVGLGDGEQATVAVTVTLGDVAAGSCEEVEGARGRHLQRLAEHVRGKLDREMEADDSVARVLAMAADDFVVQMGTDDGSVTTLIEGYPATGARSVDICMTVPGLLLATGRFEEAKGLLERLAQSLRDGLVPESLDGDVRERTPLSVGASLWFVHAAVEYRRASGDYVSWDGWLAGSVMKVVEAMLHSTGNGVSMAGDGLIVVDARHGDGWGGDGGVSRYGKLVEINVLWFNALAGVAACVAKTHEPAAEHYTKLSKRVKRSFGRVFWDERNGYLRDRVWSDPSGEEHDDRSLRANQVFATSLPRSPLPNTKKRRVLKAIREGLLMRYGLRSRAENDVRDDGGGNASVVYPWLLGPFAEGILRVGRSNTAAVSQARGVMRPLLEWLIGRGLGHLPERFECGGTVRAVGRAADARSAAEAVRVCCMLDGRSH